MVAPVIEQGHDAGVVQLGHQPGLTLESPHEGGIVGQLGADHLDRHLSADRTLIGAIHHPEAPGADALAQLVTAEGVAYGDRGRSGGGGSTQLGELGGDALCGELIYPFGPGAQRILAKIDGGGRRSIGECCACGGAHEDLSRVGHGDERLDAGCRIDEAVAVGYSFPGYVDRQHCQGMRVPQPQIALQRDGQLGGRSRIRESGEHQVAVPPHNAAAMTLETCRQRPVILDQSPFRRFAIRVPRLCRDVDVAGEHGLAGVAALRRADQRRIVVEDAPLELLQLRRRIDPDLLDECSVQPTVSTERLRLAALAIQRRHLQRPQRLSIGMLLDQRLQLADDAAMAPELEVGADALLDGLKPECIEPADLRLQPFDPGQVGVRRSPPQFECTSQHGRRLLRVLPGQLSSPGEQHLELTGVDVGRGERQAIAVSHSLDATAQRRAEVRHVGMERRTDGSWRVTAPNTVDQPIGGHCGAGTRRQQGEHSSLFGSAERDLGALYLSVYVP